MAKNTYFGKNDITPDFLRSAEENAENQFHKLNYSAPAIEVVRGSEKNQSDFTFTGRGKTLEEKFKTSNKTKRLARFKKSAPTLTIGGIIIAAAFFMFASVGSLGNQIETLITRATDTMFGSFSENTIRVTEELLAGKRGEFPDYFRERLGAQGIEVTGNAPYSLVWSGLNIPAGAFKDTYLNDINFREAFTKAKRGRSSNFYDPTALFTFGRIGLTRNLFRNYKLTGDDTADKASFKKIRSDLFDGKTTARMNTVSEEQATDDNNRPLYDDDGNPVMEKVKTGDDVKNSYGGDSRAKARTYLSDISGRVADTANITCAALKVANMLSITIATAEIYQSINYFMSNVESISKTKAGAGNNAAENQLLNFLSEPVETTYIDANTGEEKTVSGAPIQAEGFATVLAGVTPNLNKTRNYSIGAALTTTGMALGLSAINNKVCGGIRAASAAVSIAIGALGGGIVSSLATLAKTTVLNIALQGGITAALSFMIPKIAKSLFENTADSLMGIPAGETFVRGAALSNKKVARSTSGQMLADKATASSYAQHSLIANQMESELNRRNTSPFDASNPDTFIGSLLSKFAIVKSRNSALSTLGSIIGIASSSASSLLSNASGQAYAVDIANPNYQPDYDLAGTSYDKVFADESTCERLTQIGAACDMYGSEITATDPTVINVSSDDPKYVSILEENVRKNENGIWEVIPNSLLANKIMYCDERDSPFGVWDSNIANAFNISLGFGDSIPILGDVIDIVNAVSDMSPETEGWASGSYCVLNKETNPHYEDLIYLQHFTEDMRIASQLKLAEVTEKDGEVKNPILAYKEDWYEHNPIDTSDSGIIARISGHTKEEVENMIAVVEYYNFLNSYTPPISDEENKNIPTFSSDNLVSFYAPANYDVIYADVRNRSFAV